MTDYPLDIIIPVWNQPVQVRSALASFVSCSPMARLVMVNNGSERETESILEEFAEALEDRALLVATPRNIGNVAALNLGLSRTTSKFILVTSIYTTLKSGWFDTIADFFDKHPGVGSLTLKEFSKSCPTTPVEADHGSFEPMILRAELYKLAGGFDTDLDNGEWTLRDFARRSLSCGFTTCLLYSTSFHAIPHKELGSLARREERKKTARSTYSSRWGENRTIFFECTESLLGAEPAEFETALLEAARLGDRIVLPLTKSVGRVLNVSGISLLHLNIAVKPLPMLFPGRALKKLFEDTVRSCPSLLIVSDNLHVGSGLRVLSFADFSAELGVRKSCYYKGGIDD